MMAALHTGGPMRSSDVARRTDLEPPLVSRELQKLLAAGYVSRRADRSDARAGILRLTPAGTRAFLAYRRATDQIVAEAFARWSLEDLHTLAELLERMAEDFARPPGVTTHASQRRAG